MDAVAIPDLARFRLLASAIAGRTVEIAAAAHAGPVWTDGLTVFLDPDVPTDDLLRAVVVHAALLGAGSLDPDAVGPLRRPALADRYLVLEGHRAIAAMELVVPPSVLDVLDRSIAARTATPATSLALAASRVPLPPPPRVFGTIRPRMIRGAHPPIEPEPAAGSRGAARRTAAGELEPLGDDRAAGAELDLSSPVGGGGPIGRLLRRMLSDVRTGRGGSAGADAPTHATARGARAARGERAGVATSMAPTSAAGIDSPRRSTRYPEWDVHRLRYRPDWCTVIETDMPVDDHAPIVIADPRPLRRPLARLGLGLAPRRRQLQGDDIDIDAAVDARAQLAAGAAPDEAVYIDSQRFRRDLAVLVLLDVSGSAAEPGATGATVHDHQRAAATALAVALHDLGDRVALYAFRSQGRAAIQVLPLQRFGQSLDTRVLRRIGALEPGGYTRLGAAIRHGSTVLEAGAGAPRRLLVVISDGFAYDHGYEGAYGEADARRALAETRNRGIGCLCLSVGATTDPSVLRRVFGTAAHASIPRAEAMPAVAGPLFRAALRSAELQSRRSQRTQRTAARLQVDRSTA